MQIALCNLHYAICIITADLVFLQKKKIFINGLYSSPEI